MARKTIYVTGHRNPDSDAIISAMAYAYFKQQLGFDAIAVRLGEINSETEYILNLFNEFAPPLANDIRTRIRDIDIDDIITCRPEDNIKTAMELMAQNDKRVIVVTDARRHLKGLATIPDITRPIITNSDRKAELLVQTTIQNIISILHAQPIALYDVPHSNGHVHVMASVLDQNVKEKIVICPNDDGMQKAAIRNGARTLIVSQLDYFGDEILNMAEQAKCNLIISPLSLYNILKELDFAIPVSAVMTTGLTTFNFDARLDDIKNRILDSRYRCYPVLDSQNHVIGTISRYHVFKHANRSLIMVDHNELAQSITGAEESDVLEVVDHHRIGGIRTGTPVFFRNEQVGCCSTIITKIFKENNVDIPKELAGMLCCAIISDTVNFQSPTCTQQDIDIAHMLAEKAGLDIETLGPEILTAGATIKNKSVDAILHNDLKAFEIANYRVRIGQCNIVDEEAILPIRDKMAHALQEYATSHGLHLLMMVFSLIDGSGSYVLFTGRDPRIAELAFDEMGEMKDGFLYLPGIISRKLQIIPALSDAAKRLQR